MKRIYILIVCASVLVSACSKKLDIEPTQSIDETVVFTSDANIKAALIGAYEGLGAASLLGGDMQLYAELLAADGEIKWDGTYNQPREVYNKDILVTNSYVTATYTDAYYTINICNNIIAAIDVVNEADRDQVKGEALFIRGLVYFELVELFAKPYSAGNLTSAPGLQLVTTPTVGNVTESNFAPRSTLAQTYDLILADLTEAKGLMGEENDVFATTYTASAVLSRVYLQMADYAGARDEANRVIESEMYSLTPAYADAFNNPDNSTEDIFATQVSSQDGSNDMFLFWSTLTNGARNGDVDVLPKHLDFYEADDDRLAFFYIDESDVARSGKWSTRFRNLPVIRLAEMYLTRAEANFRLGTSIGATPEEDINDMIRDRVSLDPITIDLDAILLERKLELAHEGQAIHDVKRLMKSVDGLPYNDNRLVLPIPIREINAVGSGILVQNEGYN